MGIRKFGSRARNVNLVLLFWSRQIERDRGRGLRNLARATAVSRDPAWSTYRQPLWGLARRFQRTARMRITTAATAPAI